MEEVRLWPSTAKPQQPSVRTASSWGFCYTLNRASPACCCPNMLSWWHILTEYFDPRTAVRTSTYCHLFCHLQNLCMKITSGHSLPNVNTEYFYGLLEYDAM